MSPPHDTSARRIHAVLAAAMADPALLERWRRRPAALNKAGIGAAAFELDKIWRFAGLVTKVRHNDLRISLPLTFKLLDLGHLSIEAFANYAKQAAALRRSGRKSKAERMQSLFEFLDGWLDRRNPAHAAVWDMIRHERALLELQADAPSAQAEGANGRQVCAETIPVRGERVIRHEMSFNPVALVRMLRAGTYALATLPRGPFLVAYCRDQRASRIDILEIDEVTSVLLDLADGSRSIGEIAALLRGAGIPVEIDNLCGMVRELIAGGLIVQDNLSGA
ncbi:MAG: hypothetical protein WA418_37185 [Bradyrhizobium sp.]